MLHVVSLLQVLVTVLWLGTVCICEDDAVIVARVYMPQKQEAVLIKLSTVKCMGNQDVSQVSNNVAQRLWHPSVLTVITNGTCISTHVHKSCKCCSSAVCQLSDAKP